MALSMSFRASSDAGLTLLRPTMNLALLTEGKPHQSGMDPFECVLAPLAVLGCGHPVQVLRAMGEIHDLPGIGEEFLDSVPDPVRPVSHHTEPHLLLGNEAGFLHGSKSIGNLVTVRRLVPADHMLDSVVVTEIEPESLDFLPISLAFLSLAGRGFRADRLLCSIESHHHDRPPAFNPKDRPCG